MSTKTEPRDVLARTTRSRDGTRPKERNESSFGFKLQIKDELGSGFIVDIDVTRASVHDNNVNLTKKGRSASETEATRGKGRGCASA